MVLRAQGKQLLARELQSQCSEVYLLCSLDVFWDMTPYGITAGSKNFPNMKRALAKLVRALAETGHNVIVDIVFCGQKTYIELTEELEGLNFKIVKVECPLDELEKREIARGDREIGLGAYIKLIFYLLNASWYANRLALPPVCKNNILL